MVPCYLDFELAARCGGEAVIHSAHLQQSSVLHRRLQTECSGFVGDSVVHRDLAAWNVLVAGSSWTCKLFPRHAKPMNGSTILCRSSMQTF